MGIPVVRDIRANHELGRPLHGLAPAVALYGNIARQVSPVGRDLCGNQNFPTPHAIDATSSP